MNPRSSVTLLEGPSEVESVDIVMLSRDFSAYHLRTKNIFNMEDVCTYNMDL